MNDKKIVIFGSGGHGRVVLDILLESGADVLGFLDDDKAKAGRETLGCKVLGDWSWVEGRKDVGLALGIGSNLIRGKVFERAGSLGLTLASAIHPRAFVSRFAAVGEGVVVMAGAVVNPGCKLGDGVVVNTGATVDHDCDLGPFCQIWPGAHLAGSVRVGDGAYVGTGACVIPGVAIGREAVIGAGAAVVTDVPDGATVGGVPARRLKDK